MTGSVRRKILFRLARIGERMRKGRDLQVIAEMEGLLTVLQPLQQYFSLVKLMED